MQRLSLILHPFLTAISDGLVKVTEAEARKFSGKPHVLNVIRFVDKFMGENPLCCASEEIADCKKMLDDSQGEDKLKLSQKTSTVSLQIAKEKYYLKVKVKVPPDYPEKQVQ